MAEPVRTRPSEAACPGDESPVEALAIGVDAADLALLQQWHTLESGVRRLTDGLFADVEAANGLAPSSYKALLYLVAAPGRAAPMNQLAQTLGFSTAGTTKVVDRLAEAGLVERRPSDGDRRVTFTALTPAGTATVLAVTRSLAKALRAQVVDRVGEDLVGSFAEAVQKLDPAAGEC
ncbi:MarR family winged helix-turn-helix transcriptional regulator [Actinacidiphila acididurans]|uniref:MarR family winged helix-turn-helix transcriptional regulator n=1 Tax=Actinacidiphila acididurans TaxID=2784346 RepID=UPI001F2170B6|nr:MarR family transcriptional regulator [Actinacidiphila acididurans]